MEYSIQGYIHTIIEANSKEEAERRKSAKWESRKTVSGQSGYGLSF